MKPRSRIVLLILIMSGVVIAVEAISVTTLYRAAISQERQRLTEAARSQARLIEAIARFEKQYFTEDLEGQESATLHQIRDAHSRYRGFGETGEFTLSRKENSQIVFLLSHRHYDLDQPKPVPWDSQLAEPMRQALSGRSGTIVGLDYRGVMVLAAHEPVAELDLGIVAKIDMAEIRSPFINAALISGISAIFLVIIGATLFVKVTSPIVERLQKTVAELQSALAEIKTLRGILPICSYCKNIRDDSGSWSRIEDYIHKRSDASFSHGICPECLHQHFPKEYELIKKELPPGMLGKSE